MSFVWSARIEAHEAVLAALLKSAAQILLIDV